MVKMRGFCGASQVLIEDGLAYPILIGRPRVIGTRCKRMGLKVRPGEDFECINPQDDPRYRKYVDTYFELVGRKRGNSNGSKDHC